jgi:hypothetical protein
MDMSNEAEKVKHLKKRVEDKKKARKSNEEQQLAGNSRNSGWDMPRIKQMIFFPSCSLYLYVE